MFLSVPSSLETQHPLDQKTSYAEESNLDVQLYQELSGSLLVKAESVVEDLIDDVIWDLCIEVHRSAKLGYFYLDGDDGSTLINTTVENAAENTGNQPLKVKKKKKTYSAIACPICKEKSGAAKYAVHLAECFGGGGVARKSSRNATAKMQENKEEYHDCSTKPRKRKKKNNKGKKILTEEFKALESTVHMNNEISNIEDLMKDLNATTSQQSSTK